MSVEVRMVQQMSGPRGPGLDWPPVGAVMTVSEAEADVLCHTDAQHPVPIAVRTEMPQTETATAPQADVESRPGPTEDAVREENLPPEMRLPPPEPPVRRGPGRPPGSTNKPK